MSGDDTSADEMTVRERFRALANFEPVDRLPIVEWAGWWNKTIERWRSEGLDPEIKGRYDICRHFGMDVWMQDWCGARGPETPAPASHGAGIIESEEDYIRILPTLYPEGINTDMWKAMAEEQREGRAALWFTLDGFFWFPRGLLGIERHLYAFYDMPDLMHRICSELAEFNVRKIEEICRVATPDFMTFAEDMSYNHGPMLSEGLFDEFMLPYYQKVIPALEERGIVSVVDSDGEIMVPAHWFERAGVRGMLPLERQSGVDVAKLREEHPRMLFIGAFDKMVMNKGEAAMRREFERLMPVARGGGLAISCDHQTPPGVSLEDYRLYIRLFKEYAREA